MFEKEAEEYASNVFNPVQEKFFITRGLVQGHIAVAFKDGAEFGYNKAKEEMQKQGLALQSDMNKTIEQNIQLKKQNNWLEGCKLELAEHLGKTNDRVSELEQQIEKMKCCGNCKYSAQETVYSIVCKVGGVNKGEIENVEDCLVCDKWETKENE